MTVEKETGITETEKGIEIETERGDTQAQAEIFETGLKETNIKIVIIETNIVTYPNQANQNYCPSF